MQDSGRMVSLEEENRQLKAHVQVLRTFMHQMGNLGFYERNLQTGEVTPNNFWSACGYRPEDLSGESWLSLVHPDDLPRVLDVFSKPTLPHLDIDDVHHVDGYFEIEYRVRTAWGQWRWVLNRGIIVGRDENGLPVQYLGIDMDITDRTNAQEELRLQQEAAEQRALEAETLRVVGAVIAANLDRTETMRRVLEQAQMVVPYESASIFKLIDNTLEVIGSSNEVATADGVKNPEGTIATNGASPHAQVIHEEQPLIFNRVHQLFPRKLVNGRLIKSWMGVPLMLKGHLTGMLCFESSMQGFFTDIHLRMAAGFADSVAIGLENARLYEELTHLAITDELTGMYTRRWMQEYAQRLLDHTARSGADMSLLMIDVDFFKRVNDDFGHLQGDNVLKQVANMCTQELRAGDMICRYGGEEFLALLPDTGEVDAMNVAERLRSAIENTKFTDFPRPVTVSVGMTSLSKRHGIKLSELIHESDIALYAAKRQGRNCCKRFE